MVTIKLWITRMGKRRTATKDDEQKRKKKKKRCRKKRRVETKKGLAKPLSCEPSVFSIIWLVFCFKVCV